MRRRGVAYERGIPDEYLVRLVELYARFFYQYDAAPVLTVNSDNLNFVDQPGDFDLLLGRIAGMRGPREFFSMGG
ncbi:Deoxynucleoside kinase [compost metagenome]